MRHGLRGRLAELADRFRASDPGLARLRMALSATVAMASALGVEYAFAALSGTGGSARLMAMLIGAVVAMMGSQALSGTGVWRKVLVAVFFPVAMGAGLAAGAVTDRHRDLMLGGFVVVMFLAVFVRRFGLPFFFYGFMLWMGYFFASFLQLTLAMVPALVVAVTVGAVTVLVLSVTVLRTNPRAVLLSTRRAYVARGRALLRACADLLDPDDSRRRPVHGDGHDAARRRAVRRVLARQAGVAEAGLVLEGWSEEPGALPPGWSGVALRRHAIDVQHALDRIAGATSALTGVDAATRDAAFTVLDELASGHDLTGAAAIERLDVLVRETPGMDARSGVSALQLVRAAREFLDVVHGDGDPPVMDGVAYGGQDEEFEATASLMMGNLPGSPAVSRDVAARGSGWNPLARLDLTTRQAVQVAVAGALAIVLGLLVSPSRYYWAVIAAFVVFTGTASRSETLLKAVNRVVGTLLGLVAALLLAHLTNGRTVWVLTVILLSMFLGFYLLRISYGYMIFFVTIMLGQLYSLLQQLSSGLLVLRLEETAVGVAMGILVALVVSPLSTRDTVRASGGDLLTALGDLLTGVVDRMQGEIAEAELDARVRALDNRVRQLHLVAAPLTRPLVWGNDSRRTRHRLRLYAAAAVNARTLTGTIRRTPHVDQVVVAGICRSLARVAIRLAEVGPSTHDDELQGSLAAAEEILSHSRGEAADEPVLRPLVHLHGTLAELAEVAPAVEVATADQQVVRQQPQ